MKKKLALWAVLAGLPTVTPAAGYDYPYLTFETVSGTSVSVSTASLTITLSGGTLTAGDATFALSDLSRMYFATDNTTDIDQMTVSRQQTVSVYSLDGKSMGNFASISEATAALPKGVYIVKHYQGTTKIAVK